MVWCRTDRPLARGWTEVRSSDIESGTCPDVVGSPRYSTTGYSLGREEICSETGGVKGESFISYPSIFLSFSGAPQEAVEWVFASQETLTKLTRSTRDHY